MGLSARIFGLNSWSLLVPQALCGMATVGLTYAAVKRWWGTAGGLLAGAVVAATPAAALMFRFNNPDALLTLLLMAAACAVMRAVEDGKTRWLILAGSLMGFGFLTKMLQALLVLPVFALAYFVAGKPRLLKRTWQLALAGLAVVVSAGWWIAIVELWPATSRPYIGGSTTNSVFELMFGYNGLGRITGNEVGAVSSQGAITGTFASTNQLSGGTGLGRLFSGEMGVEISWLLPAALLALAAGILLVCLHRRDDAKTGRMLRASLIVWGGWLLVTGAVFSFMQGIIHPYYMVVLAPALGALLGMVIPQLWRRRGSIGWRALLAAIPAAGAVWSFVLLGRTFSWMPWLRWTLLFVGLVTSAALLAYDWPGGRFWRHSIGLGLATVALVTALGGSAAWAVATAGQPHTGAIPSSGPSGGGSFAGQGRNGGFSGGARAWGDGNGGQPPAPQGGGRMGVAPSGGAGGNRGPGGVGEGSSVSSELVALLQKDASSYRWTAAMSSASNAAPVQLASRTPIMALGGFNGTDNSLTLAQFQALVAAHRIHYYIAGGGFANSPNSGVEGQIATWVEQSFVSTTVGSTRLYDLTVPTSASTN
jgi:4-amino-4-deoxy-L-arabinose transferase-like glycosyltransferase